MHIFETTDIELIQALADKCYMDAYREIHTEEQNRFSFQEMYSTESLSRQLTHQHSHFFILNDEGENRGYLAIYPLGKHQWMLDKLYILPWEKGHGYGRIMVEHAFNWLRHASETPCQMVLGVNRRNDAVAFYKHLGFEIAESWDKPIADGRWIMDGYEMTIDLPA